ncbi:MAG TPA: oxygenase MpaB family protein, partial [Thermodesulfobacteriota bacterium]
MSWDDLAFARAVNREVVLLAGWGRALLLQVAHPLVAEGVATHGGFLRDRRGRWARLRRTLDAMLTLTFGTDEEAARVA